MHGNAHNAKMTWPMVTYTIIDHLVLCLPTCTNDNLISAVKRGI